MLRELASFVDNTPRFLSIDENTCQNPSLTQENEKQKWKFE